MNGAVQAAAHARCMSVLLLFAFFWIVAAASYSGFSGKWGLRDGSPRFGIEAMLDGTAQKPFVYRQLLPLAANFIDRYIYQRI
ncbi:hypothetical protein [Glaciimonas sp. GG7]